MAKYNKANCMAYALDINRWLQPRGWSSYDSEPYDDMPELLTQDYHLKPVSKKDMVLGKEYIAFRWGRERNNDFHFMKRGKKGHWRHKMGSTAVKVISQKEVFSPAWVTAWHSYDSEIHLFEVIGS